MNNLNPYNQELFESKFKQSATFKMLCEKNYKVYFNKFIENVTYATQRQKMAESYVSAAPWYYLDYLDDSSTVVDLGCGFNFFKPYFSKFQGIGAENDPRHFFGDLHDFVDDDFYKNHVNAYNAVFSINALHFHPLENLREICENFSAMLTPGGRGFLALNAQRMIERSTIHRNAGNQEIDTWIRNQFNNFPVKLLVFDVDLSVLNAYIDGNIRIVFEK